MRITVRNSRKVRAPILLGAIHNPQDFHGTRGPRECTSLIGDAQIQPFFIFSLLGMHTCFSIQHHSTAQVPGGGPLEAPLSPPLFPLPSQEQTSLVPTPPAFSCFFLLRHRFLPSLRTERNLSRFPFREAGTSFTKRPLSPNSFRISLRTASPSSHYDSRGTFGLSVEKYLPSLLATSPKICTDRGSGPDHSTTPSTPPPR